MSAYPDHLMDHYRHPRNFKFKPGVRYTHTSDMDNPSCGDKIQVKAVVDGEVVLDIAFEGIGCAMSLASASLMTEVAKGKKTTDILALTAQDVLDRLEITVSPVRMKCALIPLETIQKALQHPVAV